MERKYTHQTNGRTDDCVFRISQLYPHLPEDRCLGLVGVICFIGHRLVHFNRKHLFYSTLHRILDNQRKRRYILDTTTQVFEEINHSINDFSCYIQNNSLPLQA